MDPKEKYKKAGIERRKHVNVILNSQSRKKIVVAGPGTGKTHLFKEVLKGKKKSLTLTFVNTLVEDLSLELCGLSDVKTLHGFAYSALKTATNENVTVFPKLSKVIKQDAKILLNKEIEFDHLFYERDDENEHMEFYEKRKDYYGRYCGYSDIIFALVKHFENKKDKIPTYEQILVDEFQDFNKLEVSLIDLLAEKSPVLIVGDDDQALYDFKKASTEYIRQRHGDASSDYVPFSLPYCSRCTRVIVEAANDIISAAMKNGYLNGRINKEYQYFENEKKDKESEQNPKIIYSQLYAKMIPWFIGKEIKEIAKEVRKKFSVLIISPTKVQSRSIVGALKAKGFDSIESVEKKDEEGVTLLDGLKVLLDDKKSNLGWRIVSKFFLKDEDFEALLKKTDQTGTKFFEILNNDCKKEVTEIIKVLRAVSDGKNIEDEKFNLVLKKVGFDSYEKAKEFLKEEINSNFQKLVDRSIKKIPIKVTTIPGSKGLAAEYVFITYFDDQYLIKDGDKKKISDRDICNFLVTLTRAEKKVFLISSNTKEEPIFLKWIDNDRIEKVGPPNR